MFISAGGVIDGAGGILVEGVVNEEEVEVTVFVVVEEGGLGGVALVGEAVFSGFLGEGKVTVVDEEQVFSSGGHGVGGAADIDIEFTVAVNVDHSGAGAPAFLAGYAAFFGNVFEGEIPFVEEEAVVDHVAGEEDIGQAVVIDVADGYAAAVVEINIVEDVEGFAVEDGILEVDVCLVFVEMGEEVLIFFAVACTDQQETNEE